MSIAVIKTGGKQYLVKSGDKLKVEKLTAKKDGAISLETLLVADEKTGKTEVGTPAVSKKISAKVLDQGRAKKVKVVKYKPKTRYTRNKGHRQAFTEVEVGKF